MIDALRELRVEGIPTTAPAQVAILEHPDFIGVEHATPWLEGGAVEFPAADGDGTDAAAAETNSDDTSVDEHEVIVGGRRYWLGPPAGADRDVSPSAAAA